MPPGDTLEIGASATAGCAANPAAAAASLEPVTVFLPQILSAMRRADCASLFAAFNGGAENIRMVRSSGNRELEGAAAAAIRSARLPAPPPKLADSPLVYDMPVTFQ
jgi:hypothetical protein